MPTAAPDWLVAAYRTHRKRGGDPTAYAKMFDLTRAEMAEIRRRAGESDAAQIAGPAAGFIVAPPPESDAASSPAPLSEGDGTPKAIAPTVTLAPEIQAVPIRPAGKVGTAQRRSSSSDAALLSQAEEARVAALRLPPDRVNSPGLTAPTVRQGYTSNTNPNAFRIGDPARFQEAASFRDRHALHDRNIGHGAPACPGAIPTETFGAKR